MGKAEGRWREGLGREKKRETVVSIKIKIIIVK